MLIVLLLAFFSFGLSVLFIGLIFPVWAIIQCISSALETKWKVLWIILMVLFWPLGSLIYGPFFSGDKALRNTAGGFLITSIIFITAFIYGLNLAFNEMTPTTEIFIEELAKSNVDEIESRDLEIFKQNIAVLKEGIEERGPLTNKIRSVSLLLMAYNLTEDHKLDKKELDDWLRLFNQREKLDSPIFRNHQKHPPHFDEMLPLEEEPQRVDI